MKPALAYSLLMGAVCAPAGIAVGWNIAVTATGSGYDSFWAYAAVAAFITASLLWWLVVERRTRFTKLRGALAGALAGLLAHWVCWYLVIGGAWLCNVTTGGCTGSLGDAPMNPLQAIPGAAVLSLWSLVFFGIVTVPFGALAGLALAVVRRRRAALTSA